MALTEQNGVIVVDLPSSKFSFEAAKRAAYSLMARVSVSFSETADTLLCELSPAVAGIDMALAERDFRREVLDHDLRISIEQRTEPYRNAILGLAFSKTGLQDG